MHDTPELLTVVRNQPIGTPDAVSQNQPLRSCVERALQNYFVQLGEQMPTNLYELVLAEVEAPLLEVTLHKTRGNQTKAARLLGLSRGTLRKKLKQYNLD